MFKLTIILWLCLAAQLTLQLVAVAPNSSGSTDAELTEGFRQLNDYLISRVTTNSTQENTNYLLNNPPADSSSVRLAAENLLELGKMVAANACNRFSFYVLLKNYMAVHERPEDEFYRVQKLVYSFVGDHSKRCLNSYPERLAKLKSSLKMDYKLSKFAEKFADIFIKERLVVAGKLAPSTNGEPIEPSTSDYKVDFIYGIETLENPGDEAKIIAKAVKELTPIYEENNQRTVSSPSLVLNYLQTACRYYAEQLGDIFAPAGFDSMAFDPEESEYPEFSDSFYREWARFIACEFYSIDLVKPEFDDLVLAASQEQ